MHLGRIGLTICLLGSCAVAQSDLEIWRKAEDTAAEASKIGHFRDAEAQLLANQKLAETFPPKDARLPRTLFDLAQVYRAEGKYSEALGLYERVRQIYTDLYGAQSKELAQTLDGEGELYKALGDFAQAEPLLVKSLEMRQQLPPDDADLAQSKNDLGEVYTATGHFDKAEPLLVEALSTRKARTAESTEVGQSLMAIGILYEKTSRAKQAEESYRQAGSILGKTLGGEHPDYANALEHLALICQARNDFETAEPLLYRVLEIRKTAFGRNIMMWPQVSTTLRRSNVLNTNRLKRRHSTSSRWQYGRRSRDQRVLILRLTSTISEKFI
jgi:tetratricopeptide (TPR) repeat protein